MIAIVNYGVGNLYSLKCSLGAIGADCVVSGDKQKLEDADSIILPGVGAFEDAIAKLRQSGLDEVIVSECKKGKPILGICLGMQMLCDESHEYGVHKGLGLISGAVRNMADDMGTPPVKLPQIGWNSLTPLRESPILKNTAQGDFVYFVHSYYLPICADTVASAQYGSVKLTAVLQKDNLYGAQFHPEKSGKVGLNILRAFAGIKP